MEKTDREAIQLELFYAGVALGARVATAYGRAEGKRVMEVVERHKGRRAAQLEGLRAGPGEDSS